MPSSKRKPICTHGTQSLVENDYCVEGAGEEEEEEIYSQSAENACAAMHTSVRCLWRWRRIAVSDQLCRVCRVCRVCWVAEGLSSHAKTLTNLHPPPSPQKSDTCANPVQKFRRAAPFLLLYLQGDILDSHKSLYRPGIWRGHGRYKLVPAKSRPWRSGD